MSPSHARKKGIRYRYYVSLPLLQGDKQLAGSVHRVPAVEVEAAVAEAVRRELDPAASHDGRDLVREHVSRVVIRPDRLAIELTAAASSIEQGANADGPGEGDGAGQTEWHEANETDRSEDRPKVLYVPWQKPPTKRRREIIRPSGSTDHRPIRAEARARLVAAIARGRSWLKEVLAGTITIEAIAKRERCSIRKVNMTISLAFLAPHLVKAAIEGRLPRGIGMARLYEPHAEWSAQYKSFGLTPP